MKKVILGLVFVFATTSVSNAKVIQPVKPVLRIIEADCNTAFTVCDNNARYTAKKFKQLVTYEIEYNIFLNCMEGNGC